MGQRPGIHTVSAVAGQGHTSWVVSSFCRKLGWDQQGRDLKPGTGQIGWFSVISALIPSLV